MRIIWILLLIAAILILLLARINAGLAFFTDAQHIRGYVYLGLLFGLLRFRLRFIIRISKEQGLRAERVDGKGDTKSTLWPRRAKRKKPKHKGLARNLFSAFRIRRFSADIELGLSDNAPGTALLCGAIEMLLGVLAGYLHVREKRTRILTGVVPNFEETCVRVKLGCIISIRPAHIIRALWLILIRV